MTDRPETSHDAPDSIEQPVLFESEEPDGAPEPDGASEPDDRAPAKLSRAERLEAKAARLREAETRRADERRAAAEAGVDDGEPAPARQRLTVAAYALGVLSAALIAVLVVGYLSWQHQRDVNDSRASALKAAKLAPVDLSAAIGAAKSFAVDFGSYDYQHLDADFAEVSKRMTPAFAKDYTSTSSKLKPTLVQYKTKVTAAVQGYGITSASASKAVVVVFLDQTVTTSQSTVPRIDRNRLEIDLQRVHGKWLVAKLLAK